MSKTKVAPPAEEAEETLEEGAAENEGAVDTEGAEEQVADDDAPEPKPTTQAAPIIQPTAPAKVTSAFLRTLTDEQWQGVEKSTNMKRDTILANVTQNEMVSTQANLAMRDALDDAQENDPTISKYRKVMREYLDELPLDVRADPERLKKEISKAKMYAKGVLAERGVAPTKPKAKGGSVSRETPRPGEGDNDDEEEVEEGAVKPGAEVQIGKFTLKVSDLVSKDKRARMKHPGDPNGVMFRGYDQKPRFEGRE